MAFTDSTFTTLRGTAYNDLIEGSDLAERLLGLAGNDKLLGGAGGDILNGGRGDDVMIGGAGGDLYRVNSAGDLVDEESGQAEDDGAIDSVVARVDLTLPAFVENLRLAGCAVIGTGNGLDNLLIGNAAANVLYGEAGNDEMFGRAGNDALYGGEGNDHLVGGLGDDSLYGGAGDDLLSGGLGDDSLYGGDGNDVLGGAAGADHLFGGAGNDTLLGGAGADFLDGGLGADVMRGGIGADVYFVNDAGDVVDEKGWDGAVDTVLSTVSFTLGARVENLTLLGSEGISGTGNDLANLIIGNDGDNGLYGGAGKDILFGGAGRDYLDGGAGADHMYGGAGSDYYVVDSTGDQAIENADIDDGAWDVVYAGASFTLGDHIELLQLQGSSNLSGTGNDGDNYIYGNDGANLLTGLGGRDYLDGGVGADEMRGGAGADYYKVDNILDIVNEVFGQTIDDGSIDTVESSVSFTLGTNVENLNLTGSANLSGTGNEIGNLLVGNEGANILSGLGGNDYLAGRVGDDVLDGGAGTDTLEGNQGSDIFVMGKDYSFDQIADFEAGVDKIEIKADLQVDTAEQVMALAQQWGSDVAFAFGGDDLLLVRNMTIAQFDGSDFLFT